ncbi:tryptophan--tRNA ligase [Buchnera aphidicola (Chaitoregma tattakana)]|uniref:tryptophan--tRNA ligase n=1 Tax=Buchnera aphidicola TaxID=9 RepID=UPI0031B84552
MKNVKCKKKILFSAVQPTGFLTLANYLGVLKHWKDFQNKYSCIFCIANLHSLTNLNTSINIKKNILDTLAFYLACGVNPSKSIIFIQSDINEHCKMNWILNCFSYFGELTRMTQFKDKSKKNKNVNMGLLNYPILMMSDILLYNSNYVSIGDDQKQHLELTKVVAKRFNNLYGKVFSIPKNIVFDRGSRIMSLCDPVKKMSKSDSNEKNSIFLLDSRKNISEKIKCAITDSDNPSKIFYDKKNKPGVSNLLNIFSILTNNTILESEKLFFDYDYYSFKKKLSDIVCNELCKLQDRYFYFRKNEKDLLDILCIGAKQASIIAKKTLKLVEKQFFF